MKHQLKFNENSSLIDDIVYIILQIINNGASVIKQSLKKGYIPKDDPSKKGYIPKENLSKKRIHSKGWGSL